MFRFVPKIVPKFVHKIVHVNDLEIFSKIVLAIISDDVKDYVNKVVRGLSPKLYTNLSTKLSSVGRI